jgi:hypothetical protein
LRLTEIIQIYAEPVSEKKINVLGSTPQVLLIFSAIWAHQNGYPRVGEHGNGQSMKIKSMKIKDV